MALTPHDPPAGWIESVSSLGCRQLLLCRSQSSVDLLLDRINTRLTVTQGLGDSCRGPRSSFMRGLCPRNRRPTARLRGRCSGLYWQRSLKHYSTNVAHAKVKSRSGSKGERTNEGSSIESRCAIIRLRNEPSLHSRLGRARNRSCAVSCCLNQASCSSAAYKFKHINPHNVPLQMHGCPHEPTRYRQVAATGRTCAALCGDGSVLGVVYQPTRCTRQTMNVSMSLRHRPRKPGCCHLKKQDSPDHANRCMPSSAPVASDPP